MAMKSVLTIFLLSITMSLFAQHYPDRPSTHGMMLMGNETIYASHLPMFHSPHDYQIILILELTKDDQVIYQQDRKNHPGELVYTIEPETFVLPEMINYTRIFKASIYRGHFERGGSSFLKNITVKIKKVIYYKQFDKNATKPDNLHYLLFGNAKEQFLVHQISSRPDFDENLIVQLKDKKDLKLLTAHPYITVSFHEKDSEKPFSWRTHSGNSKETIRPIVFSSHQTLYLEFDDLK